MAAEVKVGLAMEVTCELRLGEAILEICEDSILGSKKSKYKGPGAGQTGYKTTHSEIPPSY